MEEMMALTRSALRQLKIFLLQEAFSEWLGALDVGWSTCAEVNKWDRRE